MKYIEILENFYHFTNRNDLSYLYHCTPKSNLKSIRQHGLLRKPTHGVNAIFFADSLEHANEYNLMHDQKESIFLLVKISDLDHELLRPDEVDLPDILDDPDTWEDYNWYDSLKMCHQCMYNGNVSPEHIFLLRNKKWIPILGKKFS